MEAPGTSVLLFACFLFLSYNCSVQLSGSVLFLQNISKQWVSLSVMKQCCAEVPEHAVNELV